MLWTHGECAFVLYSTVMIVFIRLRAIWPKDYLRGSLALGKSHQNGDYLKQAKRKSYPPTGLEPATFGLPVHCYTT